LLEHRIKPLGFNLPSGPEAAVEAVGEVIAVAGTLQKQAEQSAF
jgi:hypothetical protein